LIVLGSLAVLAAAYLLVVAPERKQASSLNAQVAAASAQVASAEGQVSSARADQQLYASEYASIVRLGKAVPAGQEMPSLMYQIAQASDQNNVDFASISTGASAGTGASSTTAPAAAAASAGFTQMPFTFVFNGSFDELYQMFHHMNEFTTRTTSGGLNVTGRLLTIQSAKLAPVGVASSPGTTPKQLLSGTITATAYVLPATQSLTGGATPTSPTGGAATPASATGSSGSPSAPAIARVTP
jgi:hypothetical protein